MKSEILELAARMGRKKVSMAEDISRSLLIRSNATRCGYW